MFSYKNKTGFTVSKENLKAIFRYCYLIIILILNPKIFSSDEELNKNINLLMTIKSSILLM